MDVRQQELLRSAWLDGKENSRPAWEQVKAWAFMAAERPLARRPSEFYPVAFDKRGILVAKNAIMEQDVMQMA